MSGWLRNLRARWSASRARKRQREAQRAYAQHGSDPNPPVGRRHGESHRQGPRLVEGSDWHRTPACSTPADILSGAYVARGSPTPSYGARRSQVGTSCTTPLLAVARAQCLMRGFRPQWDRRIGLGIGCS